MKRSVHSRRKKRQHEKKIDIVWRYTGDKAANSYIIIAGTASQRREVDPSLREAALPSGRRNHQPDRPANLGRSRGREQIRTSHAGGHGNHTADTYGRGDGPARNGRDGGYTRDRSRDQPAARYARDDVSNASSHSRLPPTEQRVHELRALRDTSFGRAERAAAERGGYREDRSRTDASRRNERRSGGAAPRGDVDERLSSAVLGGLHTGRSAAQVLCSAVFSKVSSIPFVAGVW